MRVIPTSIHGVMDYLTAVLLIASPWLFGFYNGGAETWVPVAIGAIILLQALMTRNETGAMKVIPMPAHIVSDLTIGLFLALSPWVFMFHDLIWEPHFFFGVLIVGEAILTRMTPSTTPTP
ncbi:SPW repeat domain-containing protein [Rufibacter psychrotolerans]|uniref:SPW repeat domain-containing protein n=1 Tax=Rufibacter psychrotolerans TaxID=2812556 RepID=UPI001967926F|nr:SPW repeat protein [Rufibacter sp. SYSU D00308]